MAKPFTSSLPKPDPIYTNPLLHLALRTPQTHRLHPPLPSQQCRITAHVSNRIEQTQSIRIRIIVRNRIVWRPGPRPRPCIPPLPEEQSVQSIHRLLVLGIRRQRQFAPRDATHLTGPAAHGNVARDAGGLRERRPDSLLEYGGDATEAFLGLGEGEVLHAVNGRGVGFGDEGTGVLGAEVFHGACNVGVEFFELEPEGQALEFPLELAAIVDGGCRGYG